MKILLIAHTIVMFSFNMLLVVDPALPDTFDGPLSTIHIFIVAALSGLAGSWVSLATFGLGDGVEKPGDEGDSDAIKKFARQGLTNFLLSVIGGPSSCYALYKWADVPMNLFVVVPVAAAWGIGGALLLKKLGPRLLNIVSNRVERRVNHILYDDDTFPPSNLDDTNKDKPR